MNPLRMVFCLILSVLASGAGAQMTNMVYPANGTPFTPPASADSNSDGWPDDPFAVLGDGDLWISTGGGRTVAALRWSDNNHTQTIDLEVPRAGAADQRILIESPGTLAGAGETAIVLVGVAPDLESLFGSGVAAEIAAHDGAALLPGGQYVEISVLISDDDGATFDEIDPARLQDTPITLRMEDLTVGVDAFPVLYEHATYVASDPQTGIAILAEIGEWTPAPCVTLPHDERAAEDTSYPAYVEASLRSLSVFAPLNGLTAANTGSNGSEGENTETSGSTEIGEITLGGETLTTILLNGGEELLTESEGGGGQPMALLAPGDPVWVDFGESGYEDGTEENPYNRFAEGIWTASVNGGDSILIDRRTPIYRSGESGSYNPPHTISVEAANGPVRIGESKATLFTYFTGIGAVVYEPLGESLSGLSYAINPESRTFPEGAAITVKAYPAEGYKFDGWWFPEDQTQPASPEDLLLAGIHSFTLEKNRLLWPIFSKNETNLDVADPDEDGLANFRETELGTNPNSADSDGDAMPDWWEVNYGLDPRNSQGVNGANGNPDNDAWLNTAEFQFSESPIVSVGNMHEERQRVSGMVWDLSHAGNVDPLLIAVQTTPLEISYSNLTFYAEYASGTSVTWRFNRLPGYEDYVVVEWHVGDQIIEAVEEITFIADHSLYPPFPTFDIQLIIRSPAPSDAELRGIHVLAPGPFGNAFFDGGYMEWGTPDGMPAKREQEANNKPDRAPYPRASEVYLDTIREQTPQGDIAEAFEVNLEAELDTSFSQEIFQVVWSFYDDSVQAGRLVTNGLNAHLEFDTANPPVPGLYKIRCEVRVNGESTAPPSRTGVAYILLPFAGPDVQDWIIEEARQICVGKNGGLPVGRQWVDHVIDSADITIYRIPFTDIEIPFDMTAKLERAFISISAQTFDYNRITMLEGTFAGSGSALYPTRKYNYIDGEGGTKNPMNNKVVDDPAYATIDGIAVLRGRINIVLFTVFAKSYFDGAHARGFPGPATEALEDLGIHRGAWVNDLGKEDPTATNVGLQLYYAIMDGKDNNWIKGNVLTVEAARGIQTKNDSKIYDEELWPRPDFTAPINPKTWTNSEASLDDGRTFTRPYIFIPFSDMDLIPFNGSGEN